MGPAPHFWKTALKHCLKVQKKKKGTLLNWWCHLMPATLSNCLWAYISHGETSVLKMAVLHLDIFSHFLKWQLLLLPVAADKSRPSPSSVKSGAVTVAARRLIKLTRGVYSPSRLLADLLKNKEPPRNRVRCEIYGCTREIQCATWKRAEAARLR